MCVDLSIVIEFRWLSIKYSTFASTFKLIVTPSTGPLQEWLDLLLVFDALL